MTQLHGTDTGEDLESRGFSRRQFARIAGLIGGGAALPFFNEAALAQSGGPDERTGQRESGRHNGRRSRFTVICRRNTLRSKIRPQILIGCRIPSVGSILDQTDGVTGIPPEIVTAGSSPIESVMECTWHWAPDFFAVSPPSLVPEFFF